MSRVKLSRPLIVDIGGALRDVPAIQIRQGRGDAIDISWRHDDAEVAITDQSRDGAVLGQCQDRPSQADILVQLHRHLEARVRLDHDEDVRGGQETQRFVMRHWRLSRDAPAQAEAFNDGIHVEG